MSISDLKRGDSAVVLKVDLTPDLRDRLLSLSIHAGAKLTVLKVSFRRRAFVVQAGSSRISVDGEVAKGVRVWRI